MSVSIRLSNSELEAIKDYASAYGMTVSECIRRAILERIEDEYDLKLYENAMKEFEKNPVLYSLDEVENELDI